MILIKNTLSVSVRGYAIIAYSTDGDTITDAATSRAFKYLMERIAILKPTSIEPVSPINSLFLSPKTLYIKKELRTPTKEAAKIAYW
ncbi:MAG: hypothetical protein ACK5MG_03060 [Bacteroidales bacterium]